jgi:LPXTG-motif cell wall-anchored protein
VADNYQNIGTLYNDLGKLDLALIYLDTAKLIQDSIFRPDASAFAGLYNNFGAVYTRKGDFRNALESLEKGLKLYESYLGSEHYLVANIYANIGLLLMKKGELDKSLAYFKKAYNIRLQNFGNQNSSVARTCLYIGNCFLEKRMYDDAYDWLNKGVSIYSTLSDSDPGDLADARNDFGRYFEQVGNYKEALKQYNEALRINARTLNSNNPDVANSYSLIGNIYLLKEDYGAAHKYFEKALTIRKNAYGNFHPDVSDTYRQLASSCPLDEACINEYIAQSFAAQKYKPGETEFDQVPSLLILLKTFQTRGTLLKGLYLKTENKQHLLTADKGYQRSIELIDFIKTSLEQPGSRLALQDNFYRIYEDAIWVKYALFETDKDDAYLHEAFQISEQSNAILLMEALQAVDAEEFSGIPSQLLELEHKLKVDLAYIEKQRFEEELKPDGGDQQKIAELNNKILDLHEKYHELLTNFRKNHKGYFEMRYVPEFVTVKKIQSELLRPEQTMISYFVGEENVFAFVISPTSFHTIKINKEFPLEVWVEEFRNSIAQFNPAVKELDYLNQKYANIGHELYQLIFEPIREHVKTNDIIIVPGGVLGYLPFDALLSTLPENYNSFSTHDYFIRQYQVSYSYSATLLAQMKEGNHLEKPFVAFAPTYFGDTLNVNRSDDPWRTVLGQLRYNVQEVLNIQEIMGGKVFLDSMATEENFLKEAPRAGILHLATHGKSNDRHGEYSYLAFYQIQDSIENELLFVKNLYNLNIPASMVVLSACETGIGELQRGEGIISLARGFSYAGAASIITTMWNIDDLSSSDIMVNFYRELKNEIPKDEALRNAKLNYLKKMGEGNRAHPLFWAAYVPVGNMEHLEADDYTFFILAGLALIGLVLIFIFRKNKKEHK